MICTSHNDQVKKNEIGRPCGTNGGEARRPRYRSEDTIKWIFKKNRMGWSGLDWCCSRWVQVAGCFEHGDERLGSIIYGEFFDWLRKC
jgi:hypothetical protein